MNILTVEIYFCSPFFSDVKSILVCGIEGHVCVQSTVLDFCDKGFDVNVIVDGVSSRSMVDRYAVDFLKHIHMLIRLYLHVISVQLCKFYS